MDPISSQLTLSHLDGQKENVNPGKITILNPDQFNAAMQARGQVTTYRNQQTAGLAQQNLGKQQIVNADRRITEGSEIAQLGHVMTSNGTQKVRNAEDRISALEARRAELMAKIAAKKAAVIGNPVISN